MALDPKLKQALITLGFYDTDLLPKLKDITKRFHILARKLHPDKNGGTEESTVLFQSLIAAYELAGKAAERAAPDQDDDEEVIARKIFNQFSLSSVKENLSSFTVITEKSLNAIWSQILQTGFGQPLDLGNHGLKYTINDSCNNVHSKLFLTLYRTGKILIQAEGNDHSLNMHFVSQHFEELFIKVYNRKKLLRLQSTKTPPTKLTNGRRISKTYSCPKCDQKFTDLAAFYNHKKRQHGHYERNLSLTTPSHAKPTPVTPSLDLEISQSAPTKILPPSSPITKVIAAKPVNIHCMLCGFACHDNSELDLHAKNVHEVSCKVCGSTFFTTYDLIVHTSTTHD